MVFGFGGSSPPIASDGHNEVEVLLQYYASKSTKIYHYRDAAHEVDLVLEQKSGRIVGIEVKSSSTIKTDYVKGLVRLAQNAKENFAAGYVFYGGDEILPVSKEGYTFWCIPLSALCGETSPSIS